MYTLYQRVSVPLKLLIKLIALVLFPIPGVLLLLFTAGSFLLTIIAGVCGLGASLVFLGMVVAIFQSAPLNVLFWCVVCCVFLMLLAILVTVCQSAIQFLLIQAVAYLTAILTAPLKDGGSTEEEIAARVLTQGKIYEQ